MFAKLRFVTFLIPNQDQAFCKAVQAPSATILFMAKQAKRVESGKCFWIDKRRKRERGRESIMHYRKRIWNDRFRARAHCHMLEMYSDRQALGESTIECTEDAFG